MLDLIAGALTTLKTTAEITKTFSDLKTQAEISSKVIELNGFIGTVQGQLLAAQTAQGDMVQELLRLRAELAETKAWADEKAKYELHQFDTGAVAFRIRPVAIGFGPLHYVCPACLEDGKKSILQPDEDVQHERLVCPRCRVDIAIKKLPSRNVVDLI